MFRLLSILPVCAAFLNFSSAQAAPKKDFGIDTIKYEGTGCPAGSAAVYISPDNKTFTLAFSQFFAAYGGGNGASRIDCRVHIKVRVPKGYSFSLSDTTVRGYAWLDLGLKAEHRTSYKLNGRDSDFDGSTALTRFEGPWDGYFQRTDTLSQTEVSRCGGVENLKVRTQTNISPAGSQTNPEAYGEVTVDSLDGNFTQTFRIDWKDCSKK